jgi:hypothetical protein
MERVTAIELMILALCLVSFLAPIALDLKAGVIGCLLGVFFFIGCQDAIRREAH